MKLEGYKVQSCWCGPNQALKFSEFQYKDQIRFMVVCENCGTAHNDPDPTDEALIKKLLVRSAICANANSGSPTKEEAVRVWNNEEIKVDKKKRPPKKPKPDHGKPPKKEKK